MKLTQYRAYLSVGLTAAGLVLLLVLVFGYLVHKANWADDALGAGEPRFARLLGLREAAEAVRQSRAAADQRMVRYAYPAATGADRVGTDLQQRLRAAAESAGAAVSGSQIVAGKVDNGFEDVPVSVTLEVNHEQLRAMLQDLADETPVIYVDSLTLQPQRGRGVPGERLVVQARFSVLRRLP